MATFISAGECWERENYSDVNGNTQVSYFRCPEASTSYQATPITTQDPAGTATATSNEATTDPTTYSSTYEEYQTPATSASSTATLNYFTVPTENSTTSSSTYYVASAVASVYISSSPSSNSTNNGTSSSDPNGGSDNNGKPSPLPIILAVVFATLFTLLLLGLLIFYLRRRRARRRAEMTPFYPPQGEGILSDRRVSQAFTRFPSRGSTTSYTPEPTFIQPVLGTVGLGAGVGGRILTSREKRLTMRRVGGGGEEERSEGGWEENGDEVLRRKMEGWNAVAERTSRLPDGGAEKDPFADSYSVRSNPSHPLPAPHLPSLPPPLRLPLTITTSLAPPRSSRSHLLLNPDPLSPSPSLSLNSPTTLSPQFDPAYSPTTAAEGGSSESHAPLLGLGHGQAEDGGVSLMHGGGLGQQAPPAYRWH